MRTLFFDNSGPLMQYSDGRLKIEDLNPELRTTWSMSRRELFHLGLKCLWAAVRYA